MKRILSFDVGIVNLAYCIIEKNEKTEDFKIYNWGLINIDDDKLICSHNSTKSKCDSNARYYTEKDASNNIYYCTSHYKSYCKKIDDNIFLLNKDIKCCLKDCNNKIYNILNDNIYCNEHSNIIKIKLKKQKKDIFEYIIPETKTCSILKCKHDVICNYNSLLYCEKHINQIKKTLYPKKVKSQNSNYKSINNLALTLFEKLDKHNEFFENIDEVLIENQPGDLNPRMKTISSFVYSYFVLRGIIDKKKINNVLFVSAQNKLKINKKNTDNILEKADNKKEEYILTKDLGKKYCHHLINDNKDYMDILNSYKKKDDLCDSFLQGFYYLFYKDNTMPEKYIKKLEILNKELDEENKKKIIKEINNI